MKQLLFSVTKKDFDVQTFRAGGKGGQKQNKTESGVRIVHKESKAVGESREERSQAQNKKIAFNRLTKHPLFKSYIKMKAAIISNQIKSEKELMEEVENSLKKGNLKVEINKNGKWVAIVEEAINEADP